MAIRYQLTPDKRILAGIILLVIITFLITLTVLLLQNKNASSAKSSVTSTVTSEKVDKQGSISTTDFIFPKYIKTSELKDFYPFREKRKAWSEEEISQFWLPVRKLILTSVKNEEAEIIREILGEND